MADTNKLADWAWKIFTVLLSLVIVPLAGWVWSTNLKVAELKNDLGDAETEIGRLEVEVSAARANSAAIIGIQKDIEYMRGTLGRIETKVTR